MLQQLKVAGVLVLYTLLYTHGATANAKNVLVFSTPPTQPAKVTIKHYQPIVDYLSRVTGKKIILSIPDNFIDYTHNLIDDKYDIVFDGPHFIGWRIRKRNHVVLAKFPQKLNFIVFVRKDSGIKSMRRLAGKRVCGVASPNLITLGMLDLYPNPAAIPTIVPVKGFKNALKCALQGNAVGAVVRDKFFLSRKPEIKNRFIVLYHSKNNWPHRGFSVGKEVDAKTRRLIKKALLHSEARTPARFIMKRFRVNTIVDANAEEYAPLYRLLRPIWGFHEQ